MNNKKFSFNFIKSNFTLSIIFLLVILIILTPRIPIMPLGLGELSIRVDGLISASLGILILYAMRTKLILILIFFLGFLYAKGPQSFIVSFGLFLQVISILTLPVIFFYFRKKHSNISESALNYTEKIIIWYALLNVIIAVISREVLLEICIDSMTNTGCVGSYGFFDRPYIFSIFIGSGAVFLCGSKNFSFVKISILMYGLSISDSRSIAAIMFLLSCMVYINRQKITLRKSIFMGLVVSILIISVSIGEGKMSLSTFQGNETDPSWMMRLNSISQYIDWIDMPKLFFGDGALAFYQFSEQYGEAGPIDNLYFRLASEVGIVGVVSLMLLYLIPLFRLAKNNNNIFLFTVYISSIAAISVFQESLITPRAGHVMVILGIYLIHKNTSQSLNN